jgi:hypothetical protein
MRQRRYYRLENFRRRDLQRAMRPMGAPEIEIDRVLREYRGRRWDRTAVGREINLSLARWELLGGLAKRSKTPLGLRQIWPGDRTAEEMRQYLKDRRRAADRERKKEKRDVNPKGKIKQVSPRARVLAAVLTDDWTGSRDLLARVRRRWLNGAGKCLKDNAMRQALHLAASELCEIGIADQKIEAHHGHPIRFLRWNPASAFQRKDFLNFGERTGFTNRLAPNRYKNASAHRRSATKPAISDPGFSEKKVRPLEYLSSSERTRPPSNGTAQRGLAREEGADASVSYREIRDYEAAPSGSAEGSSLGIDPARGSVSGRVFCDEKTTEERIDEPQDRGPDFPQVA